MKMFYSVTSPFVRKVMVTAHELGLADRIELMPSVASPVDRNPTIRQQNPLGQVPTLVTDDGMALYDSRVICEYLDAEGGGSLFGSGATRWRNLADAALGDGLLGAGLLARYETVLRPEPLRWDGWIQGQHGKITDAIDRIDAVAAEFGDRLDIGTITFGCALGWVDFRFPDIGWRDGRPAAAAWFATFGERPSMTATVPHA